MRDVLSSADRETNNPAAEQELTPEELLLLGSGDPEAGRQVLEEVKRQREAEAEKQTVQKAWGDAGHAGASDRPRAHLARARGPQNAENAAIQREIQEPERIPAALWPWHFCWKRCEAGGDLLWTQNPELRVIEESLLTRLSGVGALKRGWKSARCRVRGGGASAWLSSNGARSQQPRLRGLTPSGASLAPGGPEPGDFDEVQRKAGSGPTLEHVWELPKKASSRTRCKELCTHSRGATVHSCLTTWLVCWKRDLYSSVRSSGRERPRIPAVDLGGRWGSGKAALAKPDFRPSPPSVPTRSSAGELVVAVPGSLWRQ